MADTWQIRVPQQERYDLGRRASCGFQVVLEEHLRPIAEPHTRLRNTQHLNERRCQGPPESRSRFGGLPPE
jgi:hypothetical protein